jgi:hypothetical protein
MCGVRLSAGTVLAERYQLTALLGEGGMGEVWAARHLLTGKAVAVKQLTCGAHERHFGEARARFEREARSACAVDHPNVVEVFDFVGGAEPAPIMVMELLQGETLAARLARGPLSVTELARTLLPVVSAVGTAHARGIVHRDLKPSNIFLDARPHASSERVKVLDFGIAKWLAGGVEDHGLRTRTGSTLGTPSYMAPEQATGDRAADHRVDVWSLGVILYEGSSGVRPLEGENAAQLVMRLLSSGIMPIEQLVPELPSALAALIGRMLARDVGRRPADLREVYALLRELAGEDSLAFGPPGSAAAIATTPNTPSEVQAGSQGLGVDAFARTLEPATASGSRAHGALVLAAPTRTSRLVPDALVALETQALALPAHGAVDAPPPRRRGLLALVSFALLSALAAGFAFVARSGVGPESGVEAAVVSDRLERPEARLGAPAAADVARAPANDTALGKTPAGNASAGNSPASHAPARAEDDAPFVVVNSLPRVGDPESADAARAPKVPPAAESRERRARTPAAASRAARGARPSRPPSAAPAPGSAGGDADLTRTAGVSPAAPPAPILPRPPGAECETSSQCESRLCVAYTCQ